MLFLFLFADDDDDEKYDDEDDAVVVAFVVVAVANCKYDCNTRCCKVPAPGRVERRRLAWRMFSSSLVMVVVLLLPMSEKKKKKTIRMAMKKGAVGIGIRKRNTIKLYQALLLYWSQKL